MHIQTTVKKSAKFSHDFGLFYLKQSIPCTRCLVCSVCYFNDILCTVKFVYKDHPSNQHNVVIIHKSRRSLYTGSMSRKVYLCGPIKCGIYKQVVFIYR